MIKINRLECAFLEAIGRQQTSAMQENQLIGNILDETQQLRESNMDRSRDRNREREVLSESQLKQLANIRSSSAPPILPEYVSQLFILYSVDLITW